MSVHVYFLCPYCGRAFDSRVFLGSGGWLMKWLFKRHYAREKRKAEAAR